MWKLVALLALLYPYYVHCHLPSYASTPSNKVEYFCMLAETCLHDTIPICGLMGDEKRTFLDLCDLLEFACDTNMTRRTTSPPAPGERIARVRPFKKNCPVYNHIEDTEGCPVFKDPRMGK